MTKNIRFVYIMSAIVSQQELYDRQARTWGKESLKKIGSSNVIILGLNSLGVEVAKNLVLTGIKKLHICDNRKVSKNDIDCCFLYNQYDIGKVRSSVVLEK